MVDENWKNIKDYPNYMVSNLGRVKSLNYRNTGEEKILKIYKNKRGYLQVGLYKKGKFKSYSVHRLVAEHFIPNSDNKSCIDHINTNKTDNRVCNLKWVTHKENMNNPITKTKHLKFLKKNNENISKPVIQFTMDGKLVRKWNSATDVQRELGFNNCHISSCCKGKRKTANGFIWRFYYKGIWMKNHIPQKDKKVV